MKGRKLIAPVIILVGLIAILFVLTSGRTASLPVQGQLESGSTLAMDSESYDFGTISMRDGNVSTRFTVSNSSSEDVRIDSIVTSCMCTTAYVVKGDDRKGPYGMPGHGAEVPRANEVIRAGEEMLIEVVFDPAAHGPLGLGPAVRDVYLVDENGGALKFEFKAVVTP